MKEIIFIGAINNGKQAICGETVKNQHLLNFLQNHFKYVRFVDTLYWRKNPLVLLKLLYYLVFRYKSAFILSVCSLSGYSFLKLLYNIHLKRDIYYWAIGGYIGELIESGTCNVEYYKSLKKIIVEGDKIKRELQKSGLTNVTVVPNFKEINYIPMRCKRSGVLKFVFLSRIIPEKGVDLILDSVIRLNNNGYKSNFSVDFYGSIDPAYEKAFCSRVEQIPNAVYSGFLDLKQQVNFDILAKYDVMLFPTFWLGEGFPGIIIDALVAGLPIIASDWNLNRELIDEGITGVIISNQSISQLHDAMLSFINEEHNLNMMSMKCQEKASWFNINNVLNENLLINELGLKY